MPMPIGPRRCRLRDECVVRVAFLALLTRCWLLSASEMCNVVWALQNWTLLYISVTAIDPTLSRLYYGNSLQATALSRIRTDSTK